GNGPIPGNGVENVAGSGAREAGTATVYREPSVIRLRGAGRLGDCTRGRARAGGNAFEGGRSCALRFIHGHAMAARVRGTVYALWIACRIAAGLADRGGAADDGASSRDRAARQSPVGPRLRGRAGSLRLLPGDLWSGIPVQFEAPHPDRYRIRSER